MRLIARAGQSSVITPADVEAVHPSLPSGHTPWCEQSLTLRMVRENAEREYIVAVCRYSGFNVRKAARILAVTPKCLYAKLKQFGIARP